MGILKGGGGGGENGKVRDLGVLLAGEVFCVSLLCLYCSYIISIIILHILYIHIYSVCA